MGETSLHLQSPPSDSGHMACPERVSGLMGEERHILDPGRKQKALEGLKLGGVSLDRLLEVVDLVYWGI